MADAQTETSLSYCSGSHGIYQSADIDEPPQRAPEFLDILGHAQRLGVPILPITWNPMLDKLGEGLTSEVNQVLVSIQSSFAFKRTVGPIDRSYRALQSEMTVLSHPHIRNHPNILQLQGLCWDFSHRTQIRPVMVFEKIFRGSVMRFMELEGQNMTMTQRQSLCADITRAVRLLHRINIIHGDINPRNVLISTDDASGGFVAKVADFGFSTIAAGEHDLIRLPRTTTWTDPEIHRRYHTISDAKKGDIYSLAMLHAFILFQTPSRNITEGKPYSWIEDAQKNNSIGSLVHDLVMEHPDLTESSKEALYKFFDRTLNVTLSERTSDIGTLVEVEEKPSDLPMMEAKAMCVESGRRHFKIVNIIGEVMVSRSELKQHIFRCLLEDWEARSHPEVAFELAFCYKTGFGVNADWTKADTYLRYSGRQSGELNNLLTIDKPEPLSKSDSLARVAMAGGYIGSVGYGLTGLSPEDLSQIEENSSREISDVERAYPSGSWALKVHKLNYLRVLHAKMDFARAVPLASELFSSSIDDDPRTDDIYSIVSKSELADILEKQSSYAKAEMLGKQVVQYWEATHGTDNIATITTMNNLASIKTGYGKLAEAYDLSRKVLDSCERLLSSSHPNTLCVACNLAAILQKQGKYKDARSLLQPYHDSAICVLGKDDLIVLHLENLLGLLQCDLNEYDVAEHFLRRVMEVRKHRLGSNHPQALTSLSNLAYLNHLRGTFDESVRIYSEVVELRRTVLGPTHTSTLNDYINLGSVLIKIHNYPRAKEILQHCWLVSSQAYGIHNQTTSHCLNVLGDVFKGMKEFFLSSLCYTYAYEESNQAFGADHPLTLNCLVGRAIALGFLGSSPDEAKALLLDAATRLERTRGSYHPATIGAYHSLTTMLHNQGKYAEALQLAEDTLNKAEVQLGQQHPIIASLRQNREAIMSKKREVEGRENVA
ncbi:hypothetical protein F5B19DRAFT_435203 [Rostrohypoxylon terebratum]|nr:hypothetical protein F5B19DRAFT_435203 [Rostrohypoxylon terebratum]